jgi:hypothetical protein
MLALQGMRQGTANLLLDTLEKVNLDAPTLVYLLDEHTSVLRVLMEGDTEGQTRKG